MKHYLRFLITMLLLILFGGGSFGQTWQKVELKDLTSDDVFVIVDVSHGFAISNAKTSSNPKAVKVALNETGDELTGDELTGDFVEKLKWKVTSVDGDYVFTSTASSSGNILYWAGSGTGLRVGTPTSDEYKKFKEYTSGIYTGLKTKSGNRYIRFYNNQDWRCYTSTNETKLAYFKRVDDKRIVTTLTFAGRNEGSVKLGDTFTLPELKLTAAGGEVLTGKTFTYTSSDPEVASINENTGEVEILSAGNTTLTAKFVDSGDKYQSSTAEFTLKVIDPNAPNVIVFSAADNSFDKIGTYADNNNEATRKFKSASGTLYDFKIINCTKGSQNKAGCLQMHKTEGCVTSPSFGTSFPYGYKVAVYYTIGKGGKYLTISSPSLEVESTTKESEGGTADDPEYVTTISLSDPSAIFKMTTNGSVGYVSKIELTPLAAPEAPETVVLYEEKDNDNVVTDYEGKTVNVTLKRTISNTYLNPFCVPFDMTADQITAVFGEGSVVSAFTSVTGKVMNFEKVATITAGQPYIVQATKASTEISLDNVEMKLEPGSNVKQNSSELSMSFNGIVSPYTFKKNDGTELFLDKNGNLRYPSTVGSQMKGMRAYFEVLDGTGNEAKVNIGGGLSSVDKLMNGEAMTGKVYNLNGQYVGNTLDGLAKGLYIMNGKKYVVK